MARPVSARCGLLPCFFTACCGAHPEERPKGRVSKDGLGWPHGSPGDAKHRPETTCFILHHSRRPRYRSACSGARLLTMRVEVTLPKTSLPAISPPALRPPRRTL